MSESASSAAPEQERAEVRRRSEQEITSRLGAPHEARWIADEAFSDASLTAAEAAALAEKLAARRRGGEPLQHVLGHFAFRELDLVTDARALIPRPETEVVVEAALDEARRMEASGHAVRTIADLGTGSGAIACSLASALGEGDVTSRVVYATDASSLALELAAENAARCVYPWPVRIVFVLGSWFEALPPELRGHIDLIVSNPPYVSEAEWNELEPVVADYDPYEALVAGPSGTEYLELLLDSAPAWLRRGGVLVLEMAPHQSDGLVRRAEQVGFSSLEVRDDLPGRPRVFVARM